MRWPFNTSKQRLASRAKEIERDIKVFESQQALLEAATQTADAANFVTTRLKARLEDSIEQFESTARILNDALVICDSTGRIQAINPAAERMFGLDQTEVRDTYVGRLFGDGDKFAVDDTGAIWGMLPKLDEAEERGELVGIRGTGETFPLDANHTRLDRSDGTSIVLMVMRDLEESVALKGYRSIFKDTFDGILVVRDARIIAANPAATNLFGYAVEELLSKSLDMLIMPGRDKITPVPDQEAIDLKIKGKHHDGHLMEMAFTTTPIWWSGGPASLVTIKNVTKSETKVFTPSMICCFDGDFKITFVNTAYAKFYGKPRTKLIGQDIRDLLPSEECNPFLIHINSLNVDEPTRRLQLRSKDAKGEQRIQIWTDHATFEDDGSVEYQRVGYELSTKDQPAA